MGGVLRFPRFRGSVVPRFSDPAIASDLQSPLPHIILQRGFIVHWYHSHDDPLSSLRGKGSLEHGAIHMVPLFPGPCGAHAFQNGNVHTATHTHTHNISLSLCPLGRNYRYINIKHV